MSFKFTKKINPDTIFQSVKFDPSETRPAKGLDNNSNSPESGPPLYYELGKQARDLFNSGYNFGLISLNVITKSRNNNVKFMMTCIESLSRRNLFGSLEAQYEFLENLTLTEKWNTDGLVTTELCCKNKPIKDLKLTLSGSMFARNRNKIGTVEAEWSNKFCALNTKLELRGKFFLLTPSAVFKYKGLLGGVLAKFNAYTAKLSDVNFAAGFTNDDFTLHTTFNNGSECGGSIFHRVTPSVDAGVQFIYSTKKKSDIHFSLAGRYQVDENICIRGKINNFSQLGLGCEQRIRDCILMSFSVLLNVRYFAEGKYKLGFSIQFES